ncbi:MAG TPA: phosphoadenylyl-sulfate reductase [Caulobacterales bacterium]|nr:phosphoadenylyl-sulfate reductase [Caulobacterales bacterium]
MSVVDLASAARTPDERAAHYAAQLEGRTAREVLDFALNDLWPGRLAVVSSFGAESAVLLHVLSTIDKNAPVIFLETDRHFAQTLQYRDELVERLGLTNVQDRPPDADEAKAEDPRGDLWRRDPDACCVLRKVRPLTRALEGYDAWVTGRKRFQGGLRTGLALIEHDGSHYKVNPLAAWKAEEIAAYMAANDLPQHPLVAQGFPSIGCWPCTKPAENNDRSGRWADLDKTECGIHMPAARLKAL